MPENRQLAHFTKWNTRLVRPRKRWMDEVLEDYKKLKVRNRVVEIQDRSSWKRIVEYAKTYICRVIEQQDEEKQKRRRYIVVQVLKFSSLNKWKEGGEKVKILKMQNNQIPNFLIFP